MKPNYVTVELKFIALNDEDVLTASNGKDLTSEDFDYQASPWGGQA